jgi:hypothetical protein
MFKILLLAVLAALAVGCSSADADTLDTKLMENRYWVERVPTNERDMVRQLAFIHDEDMRIGADIKGSAYRIHIDIFAYRVDGDRLTRLYLQEKEKRANTARAWRCDTNGFDLCLAIGDGRYFSRKDWIIEPGQDVAAAARAWQQKIVAGD